MSEQTVASDEDVPAPVGSSTGGQHELGRLVDTRVRRLLRTRESSTAVATLARLRNNVGRPPGRDPSIWDVTLRDVSPDARSDDPTTAERAVHAAMTLFALHQQARDAPMHVRGVGFGRAVWQLGRARQDADDGTGPVRRRFNIVVTASSVDDLTHHMRGLVTQMRGESIGLDYGALADDLLQFQRPGQADAVRRRWGRQYHRLDKPGTVDDSTVSPTASTESTDETEEHA
ncbi:type I-E CRISPR-associated protein Cse2/CasB [Oerskovia flava]|uniref:type I-E CRISPR-associated protein Cse2/CasB n=1 Tax=Oerskovia flava TaxID=2986422 RepID=UPI002240AEFF|nr:type I-E CRISPR-associated protein Cse2/CasB [Oerskovia sp. JB1-3-2]